MKKLGIIVLILGIFGLNIVKEERKEERKGVFISYIELQEYIKDKDEKTAKDNIDKMIQNIKDFKLNTLILQVRPASDAIYPSKIFPYSKYITDEEKTSFDILSYFIEQAHKQQLKLIAWINPYRISTTSDINSISPSSPFYKYLNTDIIYIKDGIYWNPSKKEVKQLIVDGVKEILNYPVDGILMDDYFYPDKEIDEKDYQEYYQSHPDITESEYRLNTISEMIKEVHEVCKKHHIKFGVSPDGNIDNNYQTHYADIKKWMKDDTYIDFIMPQIYYGFYNSTRAYVKVVKEWEELLQTDKVEFHIALAFYKVGREDPYAKAGRNEWLENDNIIMREVLLSRNLRNYKGFSLFRYDNLFRQNTFTKTSKMELENLQKIIK